MPSRRVALVVALLAFTTACAGAGHDGPKGHPQGSRPVRPAPLTVGLTSSTGRTVTVAASRVSTVAQALVAAGLSVPTGRLLSVEHTVLRGNGRPGQVLLDGHLVTGAGPVRGGDHITLRRGPDTVEPTQTVTVSLPPPTDAGLYVGSRPGLARVVRGVVSHDLVSSRTLTAPRLGRLLRPGAVALTFDDGPDPTWTPRVLALLAHARVHATFCLIGREAAAHPDLVRAIVAGGHRLCDHTYDHDEHLPTDTPGRRDTEISGAYRAIADAAGVAPNFFRAPGGNWSPAVEAEARREGMTPLRWSVDPRDWSRPGTAQILSTVYQQVRPGGIILMHDGGGDRSQTVAALRQLLTRLPAMGYAFVLPPTETAPRPAPSSSTTPPGQPSPSPRASGSAAPSSGTGPG
jgi:peptidoglycan/xylan/chitin deacetylase (PgdA/CDA1 family)